MIIGSSNMKPYLLQMLKELALLGAIENRVEISSLELAKQLNTSQQTGSRYLLELDKQGTITREMGIKKQLIQITEKGEEALQDEYMRYRSIFELTDQVSFVGKVVSGMGEGRYYTAQGGYSKQFKEKLGILAFPGTLNVEIRHIDKNKIRLIKKHAGILIDSFESNNRTFGAVQCFPAKINNLDGAIVLPARSHYSNILEFISKYNLREKLKLKDDDEVSIIIFLNKDK